MISGRNRYGDWEADLIQGAAGTGFLLSIYERKSRVGRLHLLPDKSSAGTMRGIVTVLNGLKLHSITYDNGLEFAMHEQINELLDCESFFCKPYRSWEKGGVENYISAGMASANPIKPKESTSCVILYISQPMATACICNATVSKNLVLIKNRYSFSFNSASTKIVVCCQLMVVS